MSLPQSPKSAVSHTLVAEDVAIVGVGLIGGSIAAALKKRGACGQIVGCGRDSARLDVARRSGLIDRTATDVAEAVAGCDFVIVCTPVDRIADTVREAAAHCSPGALLTDVGSVKRSICRELADLACGSGPGPRFIGSHPMAGSEQSGFEHADPDLFEGRITVVTPLDRTPLDALARLKLFWSSLGSAVVALSPEAHDRAVAEISHVPHVVAAVLADMLTEANRDLAATGFRDTTRIAAGDPGLWSPILLSNVDEIIHGLDAYSGALDEFRKALAAGDEAALKKLLRTAKTKRDALG